MQMIDLFFAYARARYEIFLLRQAGAAKPWTDNPVLQGNRFCNVYREDDRTTIWFRENFRDQMAANFWTVIWGTICFRWFNRIQTGEILIANGLLHKWDGRLAKEVLKNQKPLVTGAYMVKTPIGVSPKLDGLIQCLDRVWTERSTMFLQWDRRSLRGSHEVLCQFPYLGPFMAYEVVTDLRFTTALEQARDINLWANPGPGAARGAGRIVNGNAEYFNRHKKKDYDQIQEVMISLLELSREDHYWPEDFPAWEMREVEHTLCEFDKYERAISGQGKMKQRYNGV